MPPKIISFKDLIIWQKARDHAIKIYRLADSNKFICKDFSLKNHLKSTAISISDNIAEVFEYNNNPDFYQFLRITKGSCGEIEAIVFFKRIDYIDEINGINLYEDSRQPGNQIRELFKKVKQKIRGDRKTRNP